MFLELLSSINWIDILIIGCGIRIIYIGIKNGLIAELFKLFGILCAIFITFHYYTELAKLLNTRIPITESLLKIICAGVLLAFVLLLFKLIKEGTMIAFKIQAHPVLDQWGGLAVSLLRSVFVGSLILVSLQLVQIQYLQKNARKSFFYPYISDFSPNFYKNCYEGFVSKIFPNEKLNSAVFQLKNEKISKESK